MCIRDSLELAIRHIPFGQIAIKMGFIELLGEARGSLSCLQTAAQKFEQGMQSFPLAGENLADMYLSLIHI